MLKEMKLGQLKVFAAVTADDGGYALDSDGQRHYDAKGTKADKKDLQRLQDLRDKADGNEFKAIQLANQMANAIKDADKAYRRADAAKQIFTGPFGGKGGALGKRIVEIFMKRAEAL